MQDSVQIAYRVSLISIAVNIFLSILKLIAGIAAHSSAMISDAIHSASDVFSTLIVLVGVHLSHQQADSNHPYGHEKLECIASLLLSAILFAVGFQLAKSGILKIQSGLAGNIAVPGMLALIAAVVSIAVKEWMFWYTRSAARKINSTSLLADAWHHRSDALSSVGSLIGIGGAMAGFPLMDPAVSILIALMIVKVAYDITKTAVSQLVDEAADPEITRQIAEIASGIPQVIRIDDLKTRMHASYLFVDIEIAADGSLTLVEAHRIAEAVHDAVENEFPTVKHCMVHVNPAEEAPVPESYSG